MKNIILSVVILASTAIFAQAYVLPPGVVIDHQSASTREYVGSPSIVIAPNGSYIATHDLFGPGSTSTTSAETKVFVSHDRGLHWTQTAKFHDQFWSDLFVDKGRLYLMGTSAEYGRIVIRTSANDGLTWSAAHFLTRTAGYHTAPVPVIFHDGYIYRAFEYHPKGPWGHFRAFMMWAPAGSDLTIAANWKFSNRLKFPVTENGDTWLEGNAVLGPGGNVLDILRVDDEPEVAILKLTGNRLRFDRFVHFPGGDTKFTIRFDPESRLYWALSNPALPGEQQSVSAPSSVRNTLALMSSPDLIHWTPREIVLHNADDKYHAFQYPDWQFDGRDIIAALRTAFNDGEGGAHTFHDANYLTFYRIRNFRSIGPVKLTGAPFTVAEVVQPQQLKKWEMALTRKAGELPDGVASQPIGRYGTHTTTLTTRVKTGEAEWHHDWSDIFVIVGGHGSLITGGHLIDAHTVAPGERRGSGIDGGVRQPLVPGTIVHISPEIPHQMILSHGIPITYFVVKVRGAISRP